MTGISLQIPIVDPQGVDALALLRGAAMEARALYPDLHDPNAPCPQIHRLHPAEYTSWFMMVPSQSAAARFVPLMNPQLKSVACMF